MPHYTFKHHLQHWKQTLQLNQPECTPHLAIDVAIPSYRADPTALHVLLSAGVTETNVSLRFLVQIDQMCIPATTSKWLQTQKESKMHQLRLRHNSNNMGAGMTRNALLDASAAEYIIFFDDDVQPSPGCIDAYVKAARAHPTAVGFAGEPIH